jgi:hypothetical protein
MRALAVFLALANDDKLLLWRAFVALAVARVALVLVPLGWLRAWAQRLGGPGQPVDRIVWAVSAATRRMPGATCLVSAFALQRLLSREGHASELHIGVAKRDSELAAHAWIVCEGRTLIGEHEGNDYTHLLAWRATQSSGEV